MSLTNDSFIFHMNVTLQCLNSKDNCKCCIFKYSELLKLFQEKYRCSRNLQKPMPCNAILAHGIDNGLCFEFRSKEDVIYAHEHLLEVEWFTEFLQNNLHYIFNIEDINNISGHNLKGDKCDINGNISE